MEASGVLMFSVGETAIGLDRPSYMIFGVAPHAAQGTEACRA